MKYFTLKNALFIQGAYYSFTAVWALVHLKSFFWVTQNSADPFKTHSNSVLFLMLGVLFIYTSLHAEQRRVIGRAAQGTALSLILITVFYLLRNGTSWPFWLDVAAESIFLLMLQVGFLKEKATIQRV